MKRSQRQTQRRFRSLCDYIYATTPLADITPFFMSMLRAHQGKWETFTLEEFEQRENEILQEGEG
ncbi:MAG: hypothetical protein ACOYMH_13015 [Zwartia sp.]